MRACINGANIFYTETGESTGLPVLFLHGFPFSHAMWDGQCKAVAAAKHRAIAYDIRGHGSSDVGDGQFSIEGHVDDLFGMMDHLKIGRAVIAGLSMGGYITLRALERDPGRFLGAVLCDTRSEPDSDEGKIKRAGQMAAVKKKGSAAFASDFVKAVFAPSTVGGNPAAVAFIRDIITHTSPLSIAGSLLALAARTDTTPSLSAISVPVLILVGEHDITTPPAASRLMHERIKGSVLHVIPGAAHMSNLEHPAFFNEKLLSFLKSLQNRR